MTTPRPVPRFTFRPGERAALAAERARHAQALQRLVIAIDGPAASGKSSTAREVARALGLFHLDTGAMYRALTLAAQRAGVRPDDAAGLAALARGHSIRLAPGEPQPRVWWDEADVTDAIRAPEVTAAVSQVASHAGVRQEMVRQQRLLGAPGGVILDGRDIGTVVFPDAHVKVFLVADAGTRARRRQAEDAGRGLQQDLEALVADLERRDHEDSSRRESPLVRSPDAVELDTSNLEPRDQADAVIALALRYVRGDRLTGSGPAPRGKVHAESLEARDAGQAGFHAFPSRFFHAVHWTLRVVWWLVFGVRVHVHPAARLGGSGLVACNHVGGFDPPVAGASVPFECWFIAKLELFRNPGLAALIRRVNAIPIRRGTADFVALDRAVELLGQGRNVLMFPEGTRQRAGHLGEARWGFGYVALHAGRPVVPVFIRGTRDLRPRLLRREPMEVWVGEPFWLRTSSPDDHDAYKEAGALAMERVAGLMLRSAAGAPLRGLELPGQWSAPSVLRTEGPGADPGPGPA